MIFLFPSSKVTMIIVIHFSSVGTGNFEGFLLWSQANIAADSRLESNGKYQATEATLSSIQDFDRVNNIKEIYKKKSEPRLAVGILTASRKQNTALRTSTRIASVVDRNMTDLFAQLSWSNSNDHSLKAKIEKMEFKTNSITIDYPELGPDAVIPQTWVC